jgi:hypothetical protein
LPTACGTAGVTDALTAIFDKEFGRRPHRSREKPETGGEHKADPVAVAALILSLPSATLAAIDLAERIKLRDKITRLLALIRRQHDDKGAVARIETPEGMQDLAAMDAERLLDVTSSERP